MENVNKENFLKLCKVKVGGTEFNFKLLGLNDSDLCQLLNKAFDKGCLTAWTVTDVISGHLDSLRLAVTLTTDGLNGICHLRIAKKEDGEAVKRNERELTLIKKLMVNKVLSDYVVPLFENCAYSVSTGIVFGTEYFITAYVTPLFDGSFSLKTYLEQLIGQTQTPAAVAKVMKVALDLYQGTVGQDVWVGRFDLESIFVNSVYRFSTTTNSLVLNYVKGALSDMRLTVIQPRGIVFVNFAVCDALVFIRSLMLAVRDIIEMSPQRQDSFIRGLFDEFRRASGYKEQDFRIKYVEKNPAQSSASYLTLYPEGHAEFKPGFHLFIANLQAELAYRTGVIGEKSYNSTIQLLKEKYSPKPSAK